MDVLLRCVVLSLAAFGLTQVLTSAGVALRLARWRPEGSAIDRADALFRLRLLPTAAAAAILLFAAIGLFRFESREGGEVLGWFLWTAGAVGALLLGVMAWRAVGMYLQTMRLLRVWMAGATPLTIPGLALPAFRIDTGFPVVAVVGVLRQQLVIDARVLEACSPEELAAVLAHERGHVVRRDNLRRAVFSAVPGLCDLTAAWRDATEEAADDLASASGPDVRFHLAAALLRVSRLAPAADGGVWQAQLPASALYRGEGIERRVRRLVASPAPTTGSRLRPAMLAVALLVVSAAFMAQSRLHDVMEHVVAILP